MASTAMAQQPVDAATSAGAEQAAPSGIDTLGLRADSYFLSSDVLGGRGTGTVGEQVAATYIASRLMELGLRPFARFAEAGPSPADASAYLLPFDLVAADVSRSRMEWRHQDERRTVGHGQGFVYGRVGRAALEPSEGGLVWLGAIDSAAVLTERAAGDGQPGEAGAAPPLRGRWAVVRGTLRDHAERLVPALERAGATGVIALLEGEDQLAAYAAHLGRERLMLERQPDAPVWQPGLPVLLGGPALGELLGVPSTGTPETPGAALPGRVSIQPNATFRSVASRNVAGYVPGSHPRHGREFVLYTAHYDHLGVRSGGGDSIYNGFSDNAAGVAMLLAIARAMAEDPPARSVGFLFFSGEEVGLLGSTALAAEPPVPLDRVAALVNLDAGAPPAPPRAWRLAGATRSRIEAPSRRVVEAHGWQARMDAGSPNSDHWPFARRGVPVVFLIPDRDWEGMTSDEADTLFERWDRYHQPGDEWSPAFPFGGLARYAALGLALGRELASGAADYR